MGVRHFLSTQVPSYVQGVLRTLPHTLSLCSRWRQGHWLKDRNGQWPRSIIHTSLKPSEGGLEQCLAGGTRQAGLSVS